VHRPASSRRSVSFAALALATIPLPAPAAPVDGPSDAAETRSAEAELRNLAVADGFTVDLFAAEPMLFSPSNIAVDAHGRVWVCEIVNYRPFRNKDLPLREEGDRILVLEDTDGDGELDKKNVFYQSPEIDSPHGVCVLGETVIVSAGERIVKFTDADGDLQADPGSETTLFVAVGGDQHDHGVHSVTFGPDGKLYFNLGNAVRQLNGPDGEPIVDRSGREVVMNGHPYRQGTAFRCDLDGSNVETLGWNFRNNWELAVDSFGRVWQSDNDDDGNRGCRLNLVLPGGNYGYVDEITGARWREERVGMSEEVPRRHWHLNDPGVMPNLAQTGAGSPTGIAVYEGDLLPERYRGALLHTDAGPNGLRAYFLSPDGAGFTAQGEDLLTAGNDPWFRPTDVAVAPDGSLIVADWYDPGVGGHRMEDVKRGRLFRLRPADSSKRYAAPALDLSTPEGALLAFNSPNVDAQFQGYTALISMGNKGGLTLVEQIRDGTVPAAWRSRALWALASMTELRLVVANSLKDPDERVRATGLRIFGQSNFRLSTRAASERLSSLAKLLLRDQLDSPATLREAVLSLRGVPSDAIGSDRTAAGVWAELASRYEPGDRWMLESLGIAARGRWDECLHAYLVGQHGVPGDDATRVVNHRFLVTPQARDIVWRSRATETPTLLAELILDGEHVPTDEVPGFLRAFDFQASSETKRTALRRLALSDDLPEDRAALVRLETLTRMKDAAGDDPEVRDAIARVLDAERGTERFVELVRQFDAQGRNEELLELARTRPDESAGVAAAKLLIDRGAWDALADAARSKDREAAEATIAAIGRAGDRRAVTPLIELMDDADLDVARRKAAVTALGRIKPGVELLLDRAEANELPEELSQSAAAALHSSNHSSLKGRIAAAFPPPPGREKPLPSLAELTKARGDLGNGKLIYITTGTCSKCHVVNGVGREVGPDLSEIGDKLGRQALFNSILYPSAGVSHNYETHTVLTEDGSVYNGVLVSETDDKLRLKDQEGIERTFQRSALLDHQVQDVSLMPADIQRLMTEQELIDLVEFLTTLKKK